MNEGDELGVVGRVGPAVGCDPLDAAVHPVDLGDGCLRLGHRAEGRRADEGRGPAQPAQRVLLVAGVLRHPGHGERVQRLEQQRADAADQHGGQIGVDPAGHAAGREVGLAGVEGDRGRVVPDADGAPHVARHVAAGRRGQAADEAQRDSGDGAAQRGSALHRVQRRHGESLARLTVALMRFVVVGAGAIGGSVGARLFQSGFDVTLVARGDHGRALQSGLVLEAPDETVTLPIPVVAEPAQVSWEGDADGDPVVLLAVKGQSTDQALEQLVVAPPASPWSACRTGWRTSAASCATSRTPTASASCAPPRSCGPVSCSCTRRPCRACSISDASLPAWTTGVGPSPTPSRRRPSSRWPGPTSCAGSTASS